MADGVRAGVDKEGNPIYSDGKVRKLFIATDRNIFDDGKLTFGGGSERQNKFWALYASSSTTGERFLNRNIVVNTTDRSGFIDNHAFAQTDSYRYQVTTFVTAAPELEDERLAQVQHILESLTFW